MSPLQKQNAIMKKTILSAAVLLASFIGFNASATTSAQDNNSKSAATATTDAPADVVISEDAVFENLGLNDSQKAAIASLKAERNAEREQARAERKAERQQAREAKKAVREQRRQAMQQRKRDYLNQVKGILTPEQYTLFLENVYVQTPDMPKAPAQFKARRGGDGAQVRKSDARHHDNRHGDRRDKRDRN